MKLLMEVDTIVPSPEKVMRHHGDNCPPVRWVEHCSFRKDFLEQQEMEKERPGSCWTLSSESQNCSLATSSMISPVPHPGGLVKPLREHPLTVRLSSQVFSSFVYVLESSNLNFMCVGMAVDPLPESVFLMTEILSACLQHAPQTLSGGLAEVTTSPYKRRVWPGPRWRWY